MSSFSLQFSYNLLNCIHAAMYQKHHSSMVLYQSFGCCPSREVLWQIDGRRHKLKRFPSKRTNVTSLEVPKYRTNTTVHFSYRYDSEIFSLQ